VEDDY